MSLGKNCAATTKERFGLSAFSMTIHSSFPLKMQTPRMNVDAAEHKPGGHSDNPFNIASGQ